MDDQLLARTKSLPSIDLLINAIIRNDFSFEKFKREFEYAKKEGAEDFAMPLLAVSIATRNSEAFS